MNDKRAFEAPAILTRVALLKDGGLSLGFATNELSSDEKAAVFSFYQQFGYVLFSENHFQESDIPQDNAPVEEQKTPSHRLRSVLFLYWKQLKEPGDFEAFYRGHMEAVIDRYKSFLKD